ncbi:BA14K family protein [Mesorhizobium xinjiangense]|uniref:BA14K family protein n=1 Tax=Mesorhizobium xinjiangense TaxID=2678685 RepID=UPI0012EE8F2F
MKTLGLFVALALALTGQAGLASADPWKNGGGHGRWERHGHQKWHRETHRHYREHRGERRGHWKGYRGYREYRPGYRRNDDGWWYPLAAFGAGVIIGNAINQPAPGQRSAPAYRSAGNAHVDWCYSRYRSYRAYDDTFQPYHGPRRHCNSPYN